VAHSFGLAAEADLEPEIYNPIYPDREAGTSVLVDLNYASFVGSFSRRRIWSLLREKDDLLLVNPPRWARDWGESIQTKSLEHYAGLILGARDFICMTSGGATLAAALKKPALCLFGFGQDPMYHHSALHTYVDVSGSRALAIPHAFALRNLNRLKARLGWL
jgi:hypothetical protein